MVCLREVKDRRGVVPDDALGAWETAAQAEADQLAEQRAGNPVVAWWYDLPTGLPEPLDKLGHDPAPRYVTVWSDDTVDASEAFSKARSTYERARHSRAVTTVTFGPSSTWPKRSGLIMHDWFARKAAAQ